ncbi:MAG: hypothetical protein ACRYFU_19880 [Janthinobacterium lividum]
MIDYTISHRSHYASSAELPACGHYDIFIAAYTEDDRARQIYDNVESTRKVWIILPEYQFSGTLPVEERLEAGEATNEAEFFSDLVQQLGLRAGIRLAIDISGLLAPYLLFLIRRLTALGIVNIDVLYAEPARYIEREETQFSDEIVSEVRQVFGYQGAHTTDTNADVLIVGCGYDHQLLKSVAEAKEGCRTIQMFGLPALKPDMYQQNILRAMRASESMGRGAGEHPNNHFVPAHDPFRVATFLSTLHSKEKFTNLYLCPLATKPQILGFGLFYVTECVSEPVSILYPICNSFPARTSTGVGRIWRYCTEFDFVKP